MTKHDHWEAFGDFLRAQRRLREMSLRQLAEVAKVSNPYLSQLERGMYRPSVDVLRNLATALKVSTETMLAQAGFVADEPGGAPADLEAAIRLDPSLSTEQKEAMIGVYRGFRGSAGAAPGRPRGSAPAARAPNHRGPSDAGETPTRATRSAASEASGRTRRSVAKPGTAPASRPRAPRRRQP